MAALDKGDEGPNPPSTHCACDEKSSAVAPIGSQSPLRVAIFGMGSFGTALGYVLCHNGHSVTLVGRDQKVVDAVNETHINPKYLPTHKLPKAVTATTDAKTALDGASLIIHAVPVQSSFEYLERLAPLISPDTPIVSVSKGIHVKKQMIMSDLIPAALGRDQPTAFLSGPSFAKEIMDEAPTAVVVASTNAELAKKVQHIFSSRHFRVYTTDDVIGVEFAGALKNVIAIAAGAVAGLGYGSNTLTALVTRGCRELRCLANAHGAKPETLAGLAGMGDIMLTCFGELSRNRTVGFRLGQGEKLEDIVQSMNQVAEGVPTTEMAVKYADDAKLKAPIIRAVHAVLQGKMHPREAVYALMSRPLGPEDHAPGGDCASE